ncbi:MAG TPA: hypothetical protein VJ302_05000 [Blastocatellia bacterium]|nr:hypothetical protein [Blastocatellia bacterium]
MKPVILIACIFLAIAAYYIIPAYLEAVKHRRDTPAQRVNRMMEGDGDALREAAGQSPSEIALTPGIKARIIMSLITAFATRYWYWCVGAAGVIIALLLLRKRRGAAA